MRFYIFSPLRRRVVRHSSTLVPRGRIALLCLLSLILSGPGYASHPKAHSESTKKHLVMGVYSHIRPTEIIKKFQLLTGFINQALEAKGVDYQVTLKIYPTYESAIDSLVAGDVDIARFGPVSYVMAKQQNPGLQLIAMESNHGSKLFNGVIAVAKQSEITDVSQLKGKRIAFGARRSTTGRFLSQTQLVEVGLNKDDFAEISYLGRHDKVAFAVGAGSYDAGAMNENTFNKYASSKGLRKLIEFPCVTKPWIARQGLDRALVSVLQEILLQLSDESVLRPIKRTGFVLSQDSDYDLIRQGMDGARTFDQQRLMFAIYPSERPSTVYIQLKPLLTFLESQLEAEGYFVQFKLKTFPSYRDSVAALTAGEADLGRYGPVSYIRAKQINPQIQILVREKSQKRPAGVLFTSNETEITGLEQLRDKHVAFSDRFSTEGRFLPQAELTRAKIMSVDLAGVSYLGRHDRVVFAVAAGNYDAGASRLDAFERYQVDKGLRKISQFDSLERSWLVNEHLDPALQKTLQQKLLSLGDTQVLENLKLSGFSYGDDAYYNPIRAALDAVSRFEHQE